MTALILILFGHTPHFMTENNNLSGYYLLRGVRRLDETVFAATRVFAGFAEGKGADLIKMAWNFPSSILTRSLSSVTVPPSPSLI